MTQPTVSPASGRIALVTGANTGIGRVTAIELARRGMRVFLACRSEERTRPVLEAVRAAQPQGQTTQAEWLPLELSDFGSVRACAQMFLDRGLALHLLVNNAGLAGTRGLTPSGFEYAFGVNHMGHFLLTQLLEARLRETARESGSARVVTVASRAHTRVRGIDWDAVRQPTATSTGWTEYCVSKLANVLFSAELARRLAGSGVSTYALHPGVIASDIWRRVPQPLRYLGGLFMVSNEEGARTTLHCALDARAAESGLYYSDCRPVSPTRTGQDAALAAELWRRSEGWID